MNKQRLLSNNQINIIYNAAILLLAALYIFLFSKGTSPLFSNSFFGHDGAIFITMGYSFLEGLTPYVDFFDHKGPTIIFIEALGQVLMEGRTGIFILQIINLYLILLILLKTSRLFTSSGLFISLIVFSFLLFFRFTIVEGNSTEEYCLLYNVLAVYITLQYYFETKKITNLKTILLGICFLIPFWMRYNNAGLVCACILFLFIILIKRKDWGNLKRYISILTITILLGSGLLIVYLYKVDALQDMLDATLFFNLKYGGESKVVLRTFILFLVFSITAILIMLIGTYSLYKKNKDFNLFLFVILLIVFGYFPLWSGRFYAHYLTIIIPFLSIGLLFFIKSEYITYFRSRTYYISLAVIIACLCITTIYKRSENNMDIQYAQNARLLINIIPEAERSELFSYSTWPSFYIITGTKPYCKYFITQETHGEIDRSIYTYINNKVKDEKPLWIISGINSMDNYNNKDFARFLQENYTLIQTKTDHLDRYLLLYKLNNR